MDSEILIGLFTIIVALVTPFLTYYLGNRKQRIQAVIMTIKESKESNVVIRNLSNNCVFIDNVILYQSISIYYYISQNQNKLLHPGDSTVIVFNTDTLEHYVSKSLDQGKMSKTYRKYGSYRMGFKIVIETSEGNLSTTWFKIGNKLGYWSMYDYFTYNKSYYLFRRFYNQNAVNFGFIIVFFIGLIAGVEWEAGNTTYAVLIMLMCYFSMLVLVTLHSSCGYRNNRMTILIALITGIPILIATIMNNQGTSVLIYVYIYLSATAYHWILTLKMSGWNL